MTVTAASFVQDFPEFSDPSIYPVSAITFWLTNAGLMLDSGAWGTWLDLGTELFMAHNLVMEAQAQAAANNGATPGTSQGGVVSSKSVDKVSINYDTAIAAEEGAGHYNMTVYGKRFWQMTKMVGVGCITVGPNPNTTVDPLASGNGWPGPVFL